MLNSLENSRVCYIGSVQVAGSKPIQQALEVVSASSKKRPDCILHFPQTPQLGIAFSMDAEATHGFPFLGMHEGKIGYDLRVLPDSGANPGEIIVAPGREEEFDHLDLLTSNLILQVQEENPASVLAAATEIADRFPKFDWKPLGMRKLEEALENGDIDSNGRPIKIQLSGIINSSSPLIRTKSEDGRFVLGSIWRNRRMLTIHSGLILARSILWAQSVKQFISGSVICSFDEPCFEALDKDLGSPATSTALDMYEQVWSNPKNLPYERMVHVCGGFVPEMLDYVDLLNFDALKNAELLKGHGEAVGRFMKRGGRLVLGIVPTNENHLGEIIPEIKSPKYSLKELFQQKGLKLKLKNRCVARVEEVIARLEQEGLSKDFVMNNIIISPQCGLGGLTKHPDGVRYTSLVYGMTVAVADQVFGS